MLVSPQITIVKGQPWVYGTYACTAKNQYSMAKHESTLTEAGASMSLISSIAMHLLLQSPLECLVMFPFRVKHGHQLSCQLICQAVAEECPSLLGLWSTKPFAKNFS